ncbi:hypothetical protein [Thermococcus sp. MV11]|uniref:hypothetical protein n=1 Tax=Thermococcus sp. MV11 TaxID=1638267 RepID=UPI0014313631|nr:hypothetical protein [Thermococcus sp. MV11]NJE02990.1 hypothetical protein [Thermococcus sp. MV11]
MFFERLLDPCCRVKVLDLSKFERERIIEGFRRKGFHVSELSEDVDRELAVESFLASSYGENVYVLKFGRKTYVARGEKRAVGRGWQSGNLYLIRDENGLKRFLLREISLGFRLQVELPAIAIWLGIGIGVAKMFGDNPLASFLLLFLGFPLEGVVKLIQYFVLDYCSN